MDSCKYVEPPFNMLITGMTGSGKTKYLLDLLEKDYREYFDFIVIICPTFERNSTYQDWMYVTDPEVYTISCKHEKVEKVLSTVTRVLKDTNSLVILDDVAATRSVKQRVSTLVALGFGARHLGLSVIVLTQQLTSISKPYRENISRLVAFYCPARKDMKQIADDYLNGVSKEEVKGIVRTLRENEYCCLDVLLRHPYYIHLVDKDGRVVWRSDYLSHS